ncbi:hypothetical protein E2C01_065287 [Portunus trituberculatus]|uniref:Uncharacterized protein n=1 Tax=Portunus trituberculatus TaxID=210409 RepID=A0A5B7HF75_PORTR|nr:hypothetical protein [Portunus trituberculatus]
MWRDKTAGLHAPPQD